jgi:HSP20 family molecular chaperone IbpA
VDFGVERSLLVSSAMSKLTIQTRNPPDAVFQTPCATLNGDLFGQLRGGVDGSFAPAFEVREHRDHFEFEVDVPGVRPADLAVFIAGGWVTITGQRGETPDSSDCLGYRAYERGFGRFWRAFRLWPSVTSAGARADIHGGVLTLFVPKEAAVARIGAGPRRRFRSARRDAQAQARP